MDAMLDSVPCAVSGQSGPGSDEARFVAMVHQALAEGKAEPFKAFTKLYGKAPAAAGSKASAAASKAAAARASAAAQEAAEAEEYLKELRAAHVKKHGGGGGGGGSAAAAAGGGGSEPSLADMLRKRAEERSAGMGGFLQSLEAKYGGGGGKGKGSKGATAMLEDADAAPGSGAGADSKKRKKR